MVTRWKNHARLEGWKKKETFFFSSRNKSFSSSFNHCLCNGFHIVSYLFQIPFEEDISHFLIFDPFLQTKSAKKKLISHGSLGNDKLTSIAKSRSGGLNQFCLLAGCFKVIFYFLLFVYESGPEYQKMRNIWNWYNTVCFQLFACLLAPFCPLPLSIILSFWWQ